MFIKQHTNRLEISMSKEEGKNILEVMEHFMQDEPNPKYGYDKLYLLLSEYLEEELK